jgi:hypothetical protein
MAAFIGFLVVAVVARGAVTRRGVARDPLPLSTDARTFAGRMGELLLRIRVFHTDLLAA